MSYLHSQGILHRDLKSENILLGEDMSVKVADFGISCLESQCGSGKGFTGTYRWMAPEMIKEKHHTRKVDVYSFGVVMWEILTALVPFSDMAPEQAAVAVALKVWFLIHHRDLISLCSCMDTKDLLHNVEIHLPASLLMAGEPCAECKTATACFMPCGNKPPDHAVLGDQPWQKASVWRHCLDPRELQRSPWWGPIILLVVYTTSTGPQPPPPPPSSEPSPVLPSLHAKVCISESMRPGYCLCSSIPCTICTPFNFLCFSIWARRPSIMRH